MGLMWAFGDLSGLCGVVTEPATLTHPGIDMSLAIGGLSLGCSRSTHISGSSYAHLDIFQGLIVFPVLFLSLSARIHPVLVTMATGEIQSQYLLTASVIQPSTRIAVSCFCVCLMFPSLKSEAFGQGHCTRSASEQPVRQLSGASPCVYVRVCVCVSLSALEHCANKFSLCQKRR